ncbi:High-affinity nickel-transport protein NixA [compost metagenome]
MSTVSLLLFVFVLGLRHGLDADHIAFIDGQTRYNERLGSPIARWVGSLFSLGHGGMVAIMGIALNRIARTWTIPKGFDTFAGWVSIAALFIIGTLNLSQLLRSSGQRRNFELKGLKGAIFGKISGGTTNPLMIILVGALFALAAETISQTSVWALAASTQSAYLPIVLGVVFMLGMMITDTLGGLITFRMIRHTERAGESSLRAIGWLIVLLAYGVSFYQAYTFFNPEVEMNAEAAGIAIFATVLICSLFLILRSRRRTRSLM